MFEDAHLETEYEDRVSGPDWAQASDTEDPWEDDLENLDAREEEEIYLRMVESAADCDAGLCDHYTCTEGQALAEWERGQIER